MRHPSRLTRGKKVLRSPEMVSKTTKKQKVSEKSASGAVPKSPVIQDVESVNNVQDYCAITHQSQPLSINNTHVTQPSQPPSIINKQVQHIIQNINQVEPNQATMSEPDYCLDLGTPNKNANICPAPSHLTSLAQDYWVQNGSSLHPRQVSNQSEQSPGLSLGNQNSNASIMELFGFLRQMNDNIKQLVQNQNVRAQSQLDVNGPRNLVAQNLNVKG